MSEEKRTVEVGCIWNDDHAKQVAQDWLSKNPGYVWKGEYRTTVPGVMSVLDVYSKTMDVSVEDVHHNLTKNVVSGC